MCVFDGAAWTFLEAMEYAGCMLMTGFLYESHYISKYPSRLTPLRNSWDFTTHFPTWYLE
jgi:hypothetical protein